MIGVLGACGAVVLAGLLVRASFRCGRRHRACRLPEGILRELAHHKRHCLGEASERVALELELLFGVAGDTDAALQVRPRDPRGGAGLSLARRIRVFRIFRRRI